MQIPALSDLAGRSPSLPGALSSARGKENRKSAEQWVLNRHFLFISAYFGRILAEIL